MPNGAAVILFMALVIYKTRTNGGAVTSANICSIIYWPTKAIRYWYGLPRQRRLRPRLAHRHLSVHGWKKIWPIMLMAPSGWSKIQHQSKTNWYLWRSIWRFHHIDGHVHHARCFAAGAALRPGYRLGALQPWLHRQHFKWTRLRIVLPTRRARPSIMPQGLKGHLLICHGMVDECIFQDVVRLIATFDWTRQRQLGTGRLPRLRITVCRAQQLDGWIQTNS